MSKKQFKKHELSVNDKNDALNMALRDFDLFCKYAGVNPTQLKICIERNKGLTFGQISLKLDVPKSTVKDICYRCTEEPYKEEKKEIEGSW